MDKLTSDLEKSSVGTKAAEKSDAKFWKLPVLGSGPDSSLWKGRGEPSSTQNLVKFKEVLKSTCETLVYVAEDMHRDVLDLWIGMNPSKCMVKDGVMKIQVFKLNSDSEREVMQTQKIDEEKDMIMAEFGKLKARHYSDGPRLKENAMKALALQLGYTTGKWFCILNDFDVDNKWQKLVKAFLDGKFGDDLGVKRIQVQAKANDNPHTYIRHQFKNTMNISVQTDNWTDAEKRNAVLSVLRSLNIGANWMYKPDIYTACDIYRKNEFQLKPTLS